jgi:hypothetical protein
MPTTIDCRAERAEPVYAQRRSSARQGAQVDFLDLTASRACDSGQTRDSPVGAT